MSDVKVRAARMADEAEILALVREEMKAHERADPRFKLRADAGDRYAVYLRDRMRDLDSTVFVAELDGRIAGLGIGSIRKQETFFEVGRFGYVSDLVVAPALRRHGIGRVLFERISLWLRGLGIEVVRLHVATRSDSARAFWKSLGADEFLAEAWIDLRKVDAPSGDESDEAPPPAPSSPPAEPAAADTPRAAGAYDFPDRGLAGGPEGGFAAERRP